MSEQNQQALTTIFSRLPGIVSPDLKGFMEALKQVLAQDPSAAANYLQVNRSLPEEQRILLAQVAVRATTSVNSKKVGTVLPLEIEEVLLEARTLVGVLEGIKRHSQESHFSPNQLRRARMVLGPVRALLSFLPNS